MKNIVFIDFLFIIRIWKCAVVEIEKLFSRIDNFFDCRKQSTTKKTRVINIENICQNIKEPRNCQFKIFYFIFLLTKQKYLLM